ncbi:MAG TPA: hypothetical protein VFN51_02480 [Candidatus Saccharimonadales bacterium]|nr:hypothetical protein [Candidatus Saccharimonadales bacterium]
MFKETFAKSLMDTGQRHIVKNARKSEGPDVGVDNLRISPEEALAAGINKYHLPKKLAQRLGSPAVESLIGHGYDLGQPSQGFEAETLSEQERVNPHSRPTQRLVITEQSLRDK